MYIDWNKWHETCAALWCCDVRWAFISGFNKTDHLNWFLHCIESLSQNSKIQRHSWKFWTLTCPWSPFRKWQHTLMCLHGRLFSNHFSVLFVFVLTSWQMLARVCPLHRTLNLRTLFCFTPSPWMRTYQVKKVRQREHKFFAEVAIIASECKDLQFECIQSYIKTMCVRMEYLLNPRESNNIRT